VSAVALAGWAAALCAAGGATWLWAQLTRQVELLADAGHELRGPLCAARLGLHGLGDVERAAAVDLELRRAALALDDLVAAGARRRAGRSVVLVDVGALLDDGAEAWRPLAAAFGASLCVDPVRGRALVRADPVRLAQACANLVANAVEHGGSPVRVRARVVAGRVRVEVSDAGPGLPAPVSVLATRRRRGPSGFTRRRRDAPRGRGLAISSRIAESFGGRLSAAPSRAGACVVLDLPSADAAPGPEPWQVWPPDPPPPPDRRPSAPRRIGPSRPSERPPSAPPPSGPSRPRKR
jgi:signal transduction histidine kinase